MRTTIFMMSVLFSGLCWAAPETQEVQPQDFSTCSFESVEVGKLRFRGETKEVAFERTAKACLHARIQFYQMQRGSSPTQERQILFAEDCVNKTYCKR